jgi:phosphopantetheinyl transferase (holo-ACP synthase)
MGKPHIELKTNIPYFDENGITRIHVTLSHCDIYAIAMVVLEK